jgi:nucleotide-binding universal stress UspA family protein
MPGRRQSIFKQILVGFDGSEQSKKAGDTAMGLARCLDAKILFLAVARPPEPATSVELEAVLDDAKEHFEQAFIAVWDAAKNAEVEIRTDIVVGHPAEQIIHRAELDKVDLIVLGRRGTSTFHKWILGSVSEKVLRYAHCPVMVLK